MSIADKVTAISANNSTIANKQQQVYEAGKQAGGGGERYTTTAKFADWNLFGKSDVVVNIPLITNYARLFNETTTVNNTVTHLTVNGAMDGKITSTTSAFSTTTPDNTLKHLTLNCDFSNSSISTLFGERAALEIIDGEPLNFSGQSSGKLTIAPGCINLKEIRFVPLSIRVAIDLSVCSKLSDDSIQSLVDGLQDYSEFPTYDNIYLHSDVIDKLTPAQMTELERKMWKAVM